MKDETNEVILNLIKVIEAYRKIVRDTGLVNSIQTVKELDELATNIINIVKK